VSKGIPHNKRRKDYPAVKLGRLVQSLEFYLKNGFNYLNIESEREGTRLLYFDLGTARK